MGINLLSVELYKAVAFATKQEESVLGLSVRGVRNTRLISLFNVLTTLGLRLTAVPSTSTVAAASDGAQARCWFL